MGLAKQQADSSRDITDVQNFANRPTQVTPWGTQSWDTTKGVDPATGKPIDQWTQTTTLDPKSQAALDAQQGLDAQRSGTASNIYDRVNTDLSQPMDWSSFKDFGSIPDVQDPGDPNTFRQHGEDSAYNRMTSRLDPQWQQKTQQQDVALRNQGLKPGDEAYDTAMHNLNMDKTDAYQTAMNESAAAGRDESQLAFGQAQQRGAQTFGQGMEASNAQTTQRQQQIAEALQKRGWSLNEVNALLTGQQVQNPNMPNFNPAARSETPQLTNAAQLDFQARQDKANAGAANSAGFMGGIADVGNMAANWWYGG